MNCVAKWSPSIYAIMSPLTRTPTSYLHFEGPVGGVIADGTNLVTRALALVGRTAGVIVEKCIPMGGKHQGLGTRAFK